MFRGRSKWQLVLAAVAAAACTSAAQDSIGVVEKAPVLSEEEQETLSEAQEERLESAEERDEELQDAIEEAKEEEQELVTEYREDSSSSRIGGAFNAQVLFLDEDLLTYINTYAGAGRRDRDEVADHAVFMVGGMAYSMHRGGVRVGSGFWAGYKTLRSDPYLVTRVDSSTWDTVTSEMVTTMRLIPAMIGGVFEKNFSAGPFGLFAGAMLGGGVFVIVREVEPSGDIFADVGPSELEDLGRDVSAAVAPQLAGDVHGGATIRLAPALHVGVELLLHLAYAPNGFVTGTAVSDFFTISPGARLRLQWGKDR